MPRLKKWISLALASLTLLSSVSIFSGCGESTDVEESLPTDIYIDHNNNNRRDPGDQFGFTETSFWDGSISFSVSGNPPFISRDENGVPTITVHEGMMQSPPP